MHGSGDDRESSGQILHDGVVRDAHDANADGLDRALSADVVLPLIGSFVYATVNFHNKSMLWAIEVDHEGADCLLASKFQSPELASAQFFP